MPKIFRSRKGNSERLIEPPMKPDHQSEALKIGLLDHVAARLKQHALIPDGEGILVVFRGEPTRWCCWICCINWRLPTTGGWR